MSERRTTRGGPRGSRGPAGPRGGRSRSASPAPGRGDPPPAPARPRLTGRATVLVLVVVVLAVSYASSLRAYLDQREHISDLDRRIAETGQDIEALEREKRRWDDDAYVERQARERFGYVMPGETGYQVIDEDGEPLDSPDQLSDPDVVSPVDPVAWWEPAWESVEVAGHPARAAEQPEQRIEAPGE